MMTILELLNEMIADAKEHQAQLANVGVDSVFASAIVQIQAYNHAREEVAVLESARDELGQDHLIGADWASHFPYQSMRDIAFSLLRFIAKAVGE